MVLPPFCVESTKMSVNKDTLRLLEAILQYSYATNPREMSSTTEAILALACPQALDALYSDRPIPKIRAIRLLREAYPGLTLRTCKDMVDAVLDGRCTARRAADCWGPK